jgi:DNA-binding response OmpR family regulator
MKILIAEDDPVAAEILKDALESFGHQVLATTDGISAWAEFDREPVRLIISDWMMPGKDGLSLCENVRGRAKTPYTYFILLTSRETKPENYDLATAAGVDDFLTKPLDRPTIRMRLRVAERILRFTTEIHQLRDLIPICAYCRKIRTDDNYWQIVEVYIGEQTGSNFTHGICPACAEIMRAEIEAIPRTVPDSESFEGRR